MKKILAVVVVLVLLGLGATYFLGGGVQNEVENFITQNSEFEVKKSEFNRGFGASEGVVEGLVKKEKIYAVIDENVEKFLMGEEKEIVSEIKNEIKSYFKDDFEFRYDYEVNHSILGVANGFESKGKVTILTPSYTKISNELFNTATPLEINSKVGVSGSEILANLADLKSDKFAFSGISLLSNLNTNNELKDVKFMLEDGEFKLSDLGKELGIKESKIAFGGVDYAIKFTNPESLANLSNDLIPMGNYEYDISAKNFGIIADNSNLFMLKDISSIGKSEIGGEFGVLNDKSKIGSFELYGTEIKNINSDINFQIDKNFIEYIAKNGVNFKELGKEETEKIMAEIFKKGMKITLNNLSLENTKSDKLSLKSDFDMSNFVGGEKIFDNINFKGSFVSSASASEFLSVYPHLALFGILVESQLKEFAKPQGNGFSIDFSFDPKTKDFIVGDKRIPSPLNEYNDDKIVALSVGDFMAMRNDLFAYHLSQGRFAQSFDKMTNVKFEAISANSVHLLTKNKKCIKVSIFEKTDEKEAYIKFEKSDDEEAQICQKIYESETIKSNLEQSEVEVF